MCKKGLPNAHNCAVFAGRFDKIFVAENQIPAKDKNPTNSRRETRIILKTVIKITYLNN